ncbi:DUF2207 domain-containing protein [Marinicella gelatinilytica]|uniref:DUF2207 domain-containing protein n=1 Tax=Marinicella gelatinilytica TaxID=2996017 RepID=UPI002260E2FF|nr:DUF2207 domain-containing protein [Marinicella gelatinilytica]MCX7545438.1 DUF2207 domain-containing protein [Marinicella gelatinilytica]
MQRQICVVLLLLFSAAAPAAEKILSYDSDITLHVDGEIEVVETIQVQVEHNKIRRGIFRDFPTIYKTPMLTKSTVGFEVDRVLRNGNPEPYHTEPLALGVRVFIGSQNKMVPRGLQTYTIAYRTDRQMGFLDTYDRFAWNVTGNGWNFPIDKVTATVYLPDNLPMAAIKKRQAWTGYEGDEETNYQTEINNQRVLFTSSRALQAYQGLTFQIDFSKGFFSNNRSAIIDFLNDNLFWLLMVVTLLSLMVFYWMAWDRVGRDPEPGVIVPLFYPPDGMSPAAVRYVLNEKADGKSFTAALINLAVKGYIQLTKKSSGYKLTRQKQDPKEQASKGERLILQKLLRSSDSMVIDKKYNSKVKTAQAGLIAKIKQEYKEKCFKNNWIYAFIGMGISVLVMLALLLHHNPGDRSAFGVLGQIAVFALVMFFIFKSKPLGWIPVIAVFVFMSNLNLSIELIIMLGFLIVVNLLFIYLLKAPTPFGRELMDKIEGFKLYLSTAEQNRLEIMHPPQMTPELFEKYLPYALALGVENQWSEQFATYLKQAALDPEEYQPTWYSGHSFDLSSTGSRSFGAISGGMASTLSSASTAPSSSGGGGGFSGGGGGGGGGGGW